MVNVIGIKLSTIAIALADTLNRAQVAKSMKVKRSELVGLLKSWNSLWVSVASPTGSVSCSKPINADENDSEPFRFRPCSSGPDLRLPVPVVLLGPIPPPSESVSTLRPIAAASRACPQD